MVSSTYVRPHTVSVQFLPFIYVLIISYFLRLQVIYELTQGEKQLIEDLSLVKKVCAEFSRFVSTVFMEWI